MRQAKREVSDTCGSAIILQPVTQNVLDPLLKPLHLSGREPPLSPLFEALWLLLGVSLEGRRHLSNTEKLAVDDIRSEEMQALLILS